MNECMNNKLVVPYLSHSTLCETFQVHFEENHSKEDQAFVQSLKELFGKAKKKILNEEDEALAALGSGGRLQLVKARPENIHPVSGIRTDVFPSWAPSEVKRSHFAEFKSKTCHRSYTDY
jgi:hypothetical protein